MWKLFLGAVCIGFAPIFVKLITLAPTPIGFYRCGMAAVFLFTWIIVRRREKVFSFQYERSHWRLLVLAGALFALDLFVWHRSVIYAGAGLGTILGNTQVFYSALIGILIFKERPPLKFYIAVLVGFVGIYLLVDPQGSGGTHPKYFLGVVYGLLTGAVYASYILVMRRLESFSHRVPTEEALAFVSLFSAIFLGVIALFEGSFVWPTMSDWGWLFGLAFVAQVLGWLLITKTLPKSPVSRAGLILNTQPVVAVIAGDLILGEHLSLLQKGGAALTLVAIYLGTQRKIK